MQRGISLRLGQPDVGSEVAQEPPEGGQARGVNASPRSRHAAQVVTTLSFCCTDHEHVFSSHRFAHPLREWAEGNDLK